MSDRGQSAESFNGSAAPADLLEMMLQRVKQEMAAGPDNEEIEELAARIEAESSRLGIPYIPPLSGPPFGERRK